MIIIILVLLLASSAAQTVIAGPKLNTNASELVMEAGDNITLKCSGSRSITWEYPVHFLQDSIMHERVEIESVELGSDMFESTLTARDLMYADTGRFRCIYENKDGLMKNQYSTSIYVFVSDGSHLIFFPQIEGGAPIPNLIFLSVMEGRPTTIPCLSTHPDTEVKLWKMGQEVALGTEVTYDPKRGFNIFWPTSYFSGTFTCEGVEGDVTVELTALLTFRASTAPPQPEIDASHVDILLGESYWLVCSTRVTPGTVVHLEWSHTSQEFHDQVQIGNLTRSSHEEDGFHFDRISKSLHIAAVTDEDQGIYKCTVQTHEGRTSHMETNLNVHDAAFVELRATTNQVAVQVNAPEAVLIVDILRAYPKPVLKWSRENMLIINDGRFSIRQLEHQTRLKIQHVQKGDEGLYELYAQSPDGTAQATASIFLLVQESPRVSIEMPPGYPYYMVEGVWSMKCPYSGTPTPTVHWEWQRCDRVGCNPTQNGWVDAKTGSQNSYIPTSDPEPGVSEFRVFGRESGFYRCVGSNSDGERTFSNHKNFFVTDIEQGFGYEGPPKNPLTTIVDDRVVLACYAHTFTHLGYPELYFTKNNQQDRIQNMSETLVYQSLTDHSNVAKLVLPSISKQRAGQYECIVRSTSSQNRNVAIEVYVFPVAAPHFVKKIQGETTIEPGSSHELSCDAVGQPTPTMAWFVNGTELKAREGLTFNANKTRVTFHKMVVEDSGMYSCVASNRGGNVSSNASIVVGVTTDTGGTGNRGGGLSKGQIGGIIMGVIIAVVILLAVVFILARKFAPPKYIPVEEYLKATADFKYNPEIPLDEQTEALAYDDSWEFPREQLQFDILLGQGAFGKVMKAYATDINGISGRTPVAVKMVRDYTDREQVKALMSELKILAHIGQHLNILNLLGAVTKDINQGYFYVIVEFCKYGSLRDYLLKKRKDFVDTMDDYKKLKAINKRGQAEESAAAVAGAGAAALSYVNLGEGASNDEEEENEVNEANIPLTTKDLVCYSYQIARGMEYLASRRYIHRDLAARNVLLAEDNIVKICDFGLAKDCYKYGDTYRKKTEGPVPVKWMAVESLTHKTYTTKSDVWSYAILLWELFTLGGTPYPGVEIDETFVERIRRGYRMEKPKYASEKIYAYMHLCWNEDPDMRPGFVDLVEWFGDLLQESVKQYYLELSGMYKNERSPPNGYIFMNRPDPVAGGPSNYLSMGNGLRLQNDRLRDEMDEEIPHSPDDVAVTIDTARDQVSYLRPRPSAGRNDSLLGARGGPPVEHDDGTKSYGAVPSTSRVENTRGGSKSPPVGTSPPMASQESDSEDSTDVTAPFLPKATPRKHVPLRTKKEAETTSSNENGSRTTNQRGDNPPTYSVAMKDCLHTGATEC